ncbi:MAG: peptidoglycan DD-metalloendopeptidase family protein [Acidobacteriota bacterium]
MSVRCAIVLVLLASVSGVGATETTTDGGNDLPGAVLLSDEQAQADTESPDPVDPAALEDAARARARLEREIARLTEGLSRQDGRQRDALTELSTLEKQAALAKAEHARARDRAAEAERARRTASARAERLRARHEATRRRLVRVLRALERSPRDAAVTPDGALPLASRRAEAEGVLAEELRRLAAAADRAEAEAARAFAVHEEAQVETARTQRRLGTAVSSRADQLVALRSDRRTWTEALRTARSELSAWLAGGAPAPERPGRPRRSAVAGERADVELLGLGVGLSAPLPPGTHELVGRFGKRVHPRHRTRTESHGWTWSAPAGTPIAAPATGRVLFNDWFQGFGRTLVLDHGRGFLTVLSHAEVFWPAVGELVIEGEVVGQVGDTGSLEGPRLYLQVQRDGKPVDPAAHFGPTRG